MERKRKIKIIQINFLIIGIIVIFFTYFKKENYTDEVIIPREVEAKIQNQLSDQAQDKDMFYNIEIMLCLNSLILIAFLFFKSQFMLIIIISAFLYSFSSKPKDILFLYKAFFK